MPLRDMKHLDLPPLMRHIIGDHHYTPEQMAALRQRLIDAGYLPEEGAHRVEPPKRKRPALRVPPTVSDSVVQQILPQPKAFQPYGFTGPGASFDGIGDSTGNSAGCAPPDTDIDVGQGYVVEIVNACHNGIGKFAVYTKDGTRVLGPVALANLWTTGTCATNGHGDGVVIYDQLADRWLISQFAGVAQPTDECVAVSVTGDPTGAYYIYDFPVFPGSFADYPKIGVWPDAYYTSFNVFTKDGSGFEGAGFVAFERSAMLVGDPDARMVVFKGNGSDGAYSLLPADVDGILPPPAGTPGIFVDYVSPWLWGADNYALYLWQMSVDWTNPANSTLTGPTAIEVEPFNDGLCPNQGRNCVPQPNGGEGLDALNDRLMFRLAYRNFGDHEALVVNQSVGVTNTSPPVGVRWYQLTTSAVGANDWSVVQQGTFAPVDGNSRWMGSIAMDHNGNIALGYSLSGPSTIPSIAYTGRLTTDPPGIMTQPETILLAGGGVQFSTGNRWGDYSAMTVDPADDCTFWYAQEYYAQSGAFGWSTHIGSFKFPTCTKGPSGLLQGSVTVAATGEAVADATITLTPGDIMTRPNSSGDYKMALPAGSYTACVDRFGYGRQCADIGITDGGTTVQNFQIVKAPPAIISGTVKDGSGHGYGLYAEIMIEAIGYGTVADIFTNPANGRYSIELPDDALYTFNVETPLHGYEPNSVAVTVDGSTTQDIELAVNRYSCSAAGYIFQGGGFGADFDGDSFPPDGWTVTNAANNEYPVIWRLNKNWDVENYTGGSGQAATVNDYGVGFDDTGAYDTSLVTPAIQVSDLPADAMLQFKASYAQFSNEALDLDIKIDDSGWQTVTHWSTDHGEKYALPGEEVRIDLSPWISGANSFKLRWRYHNSQSDAWDWYAQIDDIGIGHCTPASGGLIYGFVTASATDAPVNGAVIDDHAGHSMKTIVTVDDAALANGFYYAFFGPSSGAELTASVLPYLGYQSDTREVPVTAGGVVRQDFVLRSGELVSDPSKMTVDVPVNSAVSREIILSNAGDAALNFSLTNVDAPFRINAPTGPYAFHPRFEDDYDLTTISAGGREEEDDEEVGSFRFNGIVQDGEVVSSFETRLKGTYGLVFDRAADDLWVGSIAADSGDDMDHRFLPDGTPTGETIDTASFIGEFAGDMAFNDVTGMVWQLGVQNSIESCIYELDPASRLPTGRSICPDFPVSQRGLAYDPNHNSWFAVDFNSHSVYHFDSKGRILDSALITDANDKPLPLIGATYNPSTGHLFVSVSETDLSIVILDVNHNYETVGVIESAPEGWEGYIGAGLSHDCEGHLWLTNFKYEKVYEVNSGESGWCEFSDVPWIAESALAGEIPVGGIQPLTVSFNPSAYHPGDTLESQIVLISNTPDRSLVIPVTVHVTEAVPPDLAVEGAGEDTATVGDMLTYSFTVANNGRGTASAVSFTDILSDNLSYRSAEASAGTCALSDAHVTCALGGLASGDEATITIVAEAAAAGDATNTAAVASGRSDSNASDNKITIHTTLDAPEADDGDGSPSPTPIPNPNPTPKPDDDGGGGAAGWLALLFMLGLAFGGSTRKRRD